MSKINQERLKLLKSTLQVLNYGQNHPLKDQLQFVSPQVRALLERTGDGHDMLGQVQIKDEQTHKITTQQLVKIEQLEPITPSKRQNLVDCTGCIMLEDVTSDYCTIRRADVIAAEHAKEEQELLEVQNALQINQDECQAQNSLEQNGALPHSQSQKDAHIDNDELAEQSDPQMNKEEQPPPKAEDTQKSTQLNKHDSDDEQPQQFTAVLQFAIETNYPKSCDVQLISKSTFAQIDSQKWSFFSRRSRFKFVVDGVVTVSDEYPKYQVAPGVWENGIE